jgi:hypothetical protein
MTKATMNADLFNNAHLPLASAKVVIDAMAQQALEALVHAKDPLFAKLVLDRWFEARAFVDTAQSTIGAARNVLI